MPRALVIGGTGLVGRAIARRLLHSGWQVTVTGRDPSRLPGDIAAGGGVWVGADRDDDAQLRAALGDGADLLVDCIGYTPAQATKLLPLARNAQSTVFISSKAVYADANGNHSNSDDPPHFDGPIRETQATVPPQDIDYNSRAGYGANKVAAEQVLLASGLPVTVLRPSKIHGEGAVRPREWVFVKRVLDRRPVVVLARQGAGADHTTAAVNLAALVEVVAAKPGSRILNSADPDAPSGLEIARTVAHRLNHTWDEVLLDDDAPDRLGDHPWNARYPIVLDTTASLELGYRPVGDYATTVGDEIDWLVAAGAPVDDDGFFTPYFDYVAEDRYVSARRSAASPPDPR